MKKQKILKKILEEKIVIIIREDTFQKGLDKTILAAQKGANIIEVTYTTPQAGNIIHQVKTRFPNLIIGSGSVVNKEDAQDSFANNADFVVSPGFVQEVLNVCNEKNALYIPGSITPTEILNAYNKGCSLIKLFPLSFVGKDYVKSISKVMPYVSFMGTGGVNLENVQEWSKMGVSSFGLGGSLMAGQEQEIESRIKKLKELVK